VRDEEGTVEEMRRGTTRFESRSGASERGMGVRIVSECKLLCEKEGEK